MPSEHYVADVADIPEAACRIVEINGRTYGVFNIHGRYYALPNLCFHQGGPLCEGRLTGTLVATAETNWRPEWVKEGEIVRCPWHSMEVEVTTGNCLAYPGRRLRTYPVRLEAGKVMVIL